IPVSLPGSSRALRRRNFSFFLNNFCSVCSVLEEMRKLGRFPTKRRAGVERVHSHQDGNLPCCTPVGRNESWKQQPGLASRTQGAPRLGGMNPEISRIHCG